MSDPAQECPSCSIPHTNGSMCKPQSVLILKPKCHKTIQLDKDGHRVTYCMLPLNHEGKCA